MTGFHFNRNSGVNDIVLNAYSELFNRFSKENFFNRDSKSIAGSLPNAFIKDKRS